MIRLKKVFLVKLPNGKIAFIPLEKIIDCPIISPDDRMQVQIYEGEPAAKNPGPFDFILMDDFPGVPLNEKHVEAILANNGECFVRVTERNSVAVSGKEFWFCILIHLTNTTVETSSSNLITQEPEKQYSMA